MLNKNFDMAVVGESAFSYLLALEMSIKGRQVVMLDDQDGHGRSSLGPTLTLLDKEILRLWGVERDIPPLAAIEQYLVQEDLVFCVDGAQVRLGQSPASNARELARKRVGPGLGHANLEALEGAFLPYIRNLAKRIYYSQGVESFRAQSMLVECPEEVRRVFEAFRTGAQGPDPLKSQGKLTPDYWTNRTFLFAARAFFQWCPWGQASELEAYHLATALLSPCYRVDTPRLLGDLALLFKERGGQLKRTSISDWQTHNGKPWGVELASFDGIIHPRRLAFFGPLPRRLEVSLESAPEAYQALNWTLPLGGQADQVPEELWGRRVVWAQTGRLGTSMPLLEVVLGPNRAHGRILCWREEGSKVEFYRTEVSSLLGAVLGQIYPWLVGKGILWEGLGLEFGQELWPAPPVEQAARARTVAKAIGPRPRILSLRAQNKGQRLQNVDYFGPLKEGVLGALSVLLDVKDFTQLQ